MLPGCCKNGLIISKTPLIQEGLKGAITGNFPDYKLAYCRTIEELTLLQLRRSNLVIADLAVNNASPRAICEYFYSLLSQYRDIHWVFLVPKSCYPHAVDLLMGPVSTLLSDEEPIENLISVIRAGNARSEKNKQNAIIASSTV
ncbi:regulatory protein [Salmonella enterica subsp. salamae]|nr:regulatory protein [Salmonella enterica subsp. salamae]